MRPPAPAPCGSCPYRRDAPTGLWAASEYEKLPTYDGSTGEQAAKGAFAVFICHQQDGRICAGWAACHDMEQNLALRLAVSDEHLGRDDAEATIDYETPVPVFESGAAAAAHGLASIETPPPEAIRAQRRLARRLGDKIQYG